MKLMIPIRIAFAASILLVSNLLVAQTCPVISSITSSSAVCVGRSFTLEVNATSPDASPLTYSWFKNGVAITSATANQYIISSFSASDAASYTVKVGNACGTLTLSNAVQLTASNVPVITSIFSTPTAICVGADYNTSVTATTNTGDALSYQWSKGSVNISGATTASYLISRTVEGDAGLFKVAVTNSCGTVNSSVQQLVVLKSPVINTQPVTAQVCSGNSFLSTADVTGADTYAWFKNNIAIGNNTRNLSISSIQTADGGTYKYSVTNTCGTVSSNDAVLTVKAKPTLQTVTTGATICQGTATTLTVVANGNNDNAMTYQWSLAGSTITGAISASYNISGFATSNVGTYSIAVSNSCGTTTSTSVGMDCSLALSSAPTITSVFTSPLSICEGQNYSTQVVANSNAGGALSYQWKRSGVILPGATSAVLNFTGLRTIDAGIYTLDVINSCNTTTSANLQLDVLQKPIITVQPVGTTICVGASINLSADVTGATAYKWQKDGIDIGNSTKIFSVSTAIAANAGVYTFLAWNTCGSMMSSSATIVLNNKPVINSIVAPASVCAGTAATLVSNVSGNGDNNLTYTWSKDGAAILGSNTPTLIVANFQSANAGKYVLEVGNACGPVNSTSAGLDKTIQLIQAPLIASVASQNVCLNASVNVSPSLTNVAGGSITYQWYFEGSAMSSQRAAQLNISNIQANQSGRYYLTVNNGCATSSGTPFNVNVLELPVIKTQPTASSDICMGAIFSLQVVATDAQAFQWYKDDAAIPGATSADFSISSLLITDAGRYNVKVSNNCGYSITSSNAILNVGKVPTIVSGPSNISACVGQPASVSVNANTNGGGALQYAWTSSTGSIVDARNSTYSIASVAVIDAKVYTVAVSNRCGSINGGSFTLAVADKPTVAIATSIPNSVTTGNPSVCIGSPITFNVTENAKGSPLTYTWYKDDVSKGVQSTNALTIASSASSDAGLYKLSVSNACGNTLSNNIIVEVQDKPVFVLQPASITKCERTTLNLSALAQNRSGTSSPINYNWYFNGNSLSSNNANLTLSNIAPANTGNYRLEAGNMCGSVFSDVATVTVVSAPKYSILTPEKEFSICSAPSQIKSIALNVYAENSVPPNISWSTNFGSIIGTTNTPTITIGSVGRNATYFATMTNACGTVQLKDGLGVIVYNESVLPSVSKYTMPPLTTFCERSLIKLNIATNSNGYETYTWKLNTKEVQTTQSGNPNSSDFQKIATAADGGTYTVDITNSCGTLANAVTIPVAVNPTPNIDFNVSSQATQCLAGNIFTFNNTSTNTTGGIRYTWDFGDGSKDISAILTASHTYTISGTQIVKLTGVNDFGCTSSNTRNVVIAADPRITSQPVGKVVCEGDRYLLSATVNDGGATSLSYQWYFNGQPISNNNTNSYAIVSMSASNAGSYYLKVMNSGCTLTAQSEPVNVSYQERPDVSFNVGGKSLKTCITAAEYTFTNTTPTVAGITYLWTFSDGTFLTSTNVVHQFLNTGIYDVSLTATAGGCSSTGYLNGNASNRITIDGIPVINKDLPSLTTVKKGAPIVLTIIASAVDASGAQMPLNYYWYKEPSSSVIGTNSATFNSITSALLSDSGRYYVTANNVCGSTKSNTTLVKVHDIPSIILQPIATRACLGKTVQLKVEGISNDNSSPLYQWYYRQDINATPLPIPNATGPILNVASFARKDVGNYYVMLSNTIGEVQSNSILVQADSLPTVNSISSIPSLESGICVNTALQLDASVSTMSSSTYTTSWEQNGVALAGQNALRINFPSIKKSNAGEIAISVSNACGTTRSMININVVDIPQFNQSPSAVTTCVNGAATFISKIQLVSDGSPFGYQWLKDGINYIGAGVATSEQLSLSNVQVVDNGYYALQSTNACGINTSSTAKLTVVSASPSITQQPSAINTCAGIQNTVTLVASSEDNKLFYSWYKNGNLLSNEIASQLSFNSIAPTDAGTYKAIISNGCNLSTTSNTFQVVVKEKVSLNGLIADKQICVGENLGADIRSYLNGADINTIYQWKLNGINLADASAKTSSLTLLNLSKTNDGLYSILASNSCGASSLNLFKLTTTSSPEIMTQPVAGFVCAGGSFTNTVVVANAAQLPLSYQWYKDGNSIANNGISQQLLLQNIAVADQGLYAVRVSNSCGTTQSSSARLSLVGSPVIAQQPSAISSCSGLENTATVVASSDDNRLAYSWYKDGGLIAGQINSQLIFSKIGSIDVGTYKVVVTNGCNLSTTSVNFQIVVKEKIALNGAIADKSLCVGSILNADISGFLTGTDITSTYQWKLNGIDVADASAKTNFLKLLNLSKTNDGSYSMLASNSCGASSLNLFKLTTTSSPEIMTQPVAGFVCAGGSFTNTVVVANAAQLPLSYQWYKDGNSIANNGISQQLLLQNIAVADQGLYAVRVSNSCGTTQSSSARLSLVGSPVIAQQPSAISSCSGLENTATVVASSDDNRLAYSWYKDGGLIAGQINSQLIFSKIGSIDVGTYKVVVTNGCNLSTTSVNFQIVVKEKIALNGAIADKSLCVGSILNADISGFLTGTDITSTYQWKLNGIDVADASAKTNFLKLLNLSKTNDGSYSMLASNSCGASSLNLFKLTTTSSPEIMTQPVAGFVCAGGSFTNTVVVANAAQLPLSYQWYKDGNSIANNGISQQLLLQNIAVADQGLYAVRVSNSCGTTQSSSARLSLVGSPVIAQQPLPINACVGDESIAIVIASSDDNRISYSWYKDGVQISGQVGPQLIFSKIGSSDVGIYKAMVTNGCNLSSVTGNFQVVIKEKISQTGSIADKQVCVGTDLQIDISKTIKGADLSSSYQWRLNGVNISDASATTNTIKLLSVTKTNVGNYSVLATNSCGSSMLDLFKLGVTNLPMIETQPLPGAVCENLDWSNKVVVSNPDQIGFIYQWYKDGVVLDGANKPELYISSANASNQGVYSVRLSSACGSVMSNKELFQVRAKPEVGISLLGTAPSQCLESNAFVFKPNVLISDNSTVDLTWDFGDGVFSKQNQVSHSYQFANDFTVYLFAKSAYGCLDTAKQSISVNTKPIVIDNILNQTICAGGQLNYNVNVKLKPNELVGYQWFFNQDPIANAVKSSYSLDNVQLTNNGLYKLRITNACGIAYSSESVLKVAEKPLVTVPLPVNKKVCEGVSFTLKPTIFSLLPNTYQWYKNGIPYVGQELDSLLMKRFSNSDVASFSVTISNRCGTTTSKDGNLIMKNVPTSGQTLTRDTICYQTGTVLKIADYLNNDDSLFFSWYKDGALIPAASTSQYSIAKFNSPDAGSYSVGLLNSCGLLNVPVAKLTLNQIFANYRLDTSDACKGKLSVNMLDTTKSLFPIVDYYWQVKEEKKILSNLNSTNYQFTNSGTYTIRHAVMDAKGCISDTISKSVINYGKPTASFSINDTCLTMPSVALNNSIYGHGSSKILRYTWNFGDTVIVRNTATVPGYIYKTPGSKKLSLVVASDSSCVTDTLSKTLMVYGKPIASFTSQDSCQGFPVLFTNRSSTSYLPDSVVNFSWNFDDGTVVTSKNPQHIFKQYGAYKVKLTAYSSSCPFLFADTTINFTVKTPRANIEYPRIQTVKKVVGQLNANGDGRSYTWFPYTGLTDTKIRNPKFSLSDDKVVYTITIVDSAGCVYKDKQEVWAFNKPDIYLSTGFSPNKDGINDRYAPEYVEIKILEYFRVADKHNRQVFITNALSDKWDGSYNGNPLPPDPYLVTVSGIDVFGNKIVRQGIVVLVK